MTPTNNINEPAKPQQWLLRALGVRLRFLLVMGALALSMTIWPWLRAGWDRVIVGWTISSDEYAVSSDSEFFCPMDPGIISAWPSICPICNMDLIARKKMDAILLPEGVLSRMQISPYRVQLAGVRTESVQTNAPESETVSIPTTAVVHRDNGDIVYVETMPGMFDALPVTLGSKHGDRYAVQSGLKVGQRVVSVGAFLIDAETRLNPSVATQFFGASHHQLASTPPKLAQRPAQIVASPLSNSEQQLVESQVNCPVTGAPLGSMGQPVFVSVDGRKVALCCKGCEGRFLADKAKYFELLKPADPPGPSTP